MGMSKAKILIIEDEKDIVRMLEYNLAKEGFKVLSAHDGRKGLDIARRERPDLVLLDLMLPGLDGLEVCKALKSDKGTASGRVIILTAKAQEPDKVIGLELGADDYITKPFSVRELVARVKAVLRRGSEKETASKSLHIGDIRIDLSKIIVTVKDRPVELTAKEFELLKALVRSDGRVLSRDVLLDMVWGLDSAMDIQTRTVDVHIRTLRKKLKSEARRIVTVKSYGYRFEAEDTD
jgi:DNA-binding response OmpR family regulator